MDWVIGVVLAEALDSVRRRLGRIAAQEPTTPEHIECSLRAPAGQVYGIGASWIAGTATIAHESIRFAPSGGADAVTMTVFSIDPALADASRGTYRNARVLMHTAEGALECSLQRSVVDRTRRVLSTTGTPPLQL